MKTRALLPLLALLALALSASASTYTLRWGDTLTTVAQRFGVGVQALAAANGITNPDRVVAGTALTVPARGGVAASAATAAPTVWHVVQRGENLTLIARRFGTTVAELRQINRLADPDHLREGQRLAVTGPRAAAVAGAIPISATRAGVCPVRGAGPWDVSDSFSAPRPGGSRHEGNDIFARRGTPVVAPAGGTLRLVQGVRAGNAFYLTADDSTVYYGAHLDGYRAVPGRIEAGQPIGAVGNSGDAGATPPHLHFEVKPGGGAPVDPHGALRAWCRG